MAEAPGHNNPPHVIELDEELRKFLLENCESNLHMGLALLNKAKSRETGEKLVDMIEKFKRLHAKVAIGDERKYRDT